MDEKDVQEDGLKSELNISISAIRFHIGKIIHIYFHTGKIITSLDHGQDVLSL